MTYCVAVGVGQGLVMLSDSRTNAGIDDVSAYSKMWSYGIPGERQFIICSAGNLATTQSVIAQLESDLIDAPVNLNTVRSVASAATYLGAMSVRNQRGTGGGPVFEAAFLIGGQVKSSPCRAFRVYPEGNHISCAPQTPFLQIGEAKYGKPILDRVIDEQTDIEQAALCALLSMDATMRSNLSVGPPIEMTLYSRDSLQPGRYVRFEEESRYLRKLRREWNAHLKEAMSVMPPIDWTENDPP